MGGCHATGHCATGRHAMERRAARPAQGWRVHTPPWPGSAQGWAPVPASAPSPAAPRWAAGRRPRVETHLKEVGGGHPGRPASCTAALSRQNKIPEKAPENKAPEKGQRMAACTAQGPCACLQGAAPLPAPRLDRQHPGDEAGRAVRGVLHHPTMAAPSCPSPTGAPGHVPGESPAAPVPRLMSHTSPVAAAVNANLQWDRLKIINRAGFPLGTAGLRWGSVLPGCPMPWPLPGSRRAPARALRGASLLPGQGGWTRP